MDGDGSNQLLLRRISLLATVFLLLAQFAHAQMNSCPSAGCSGTPPTGAWAWDPNLKNFQYDNSGTWTALATSPGFVHSPSVTTGAVTLSPNQCTQVSCTDDYRIAGPTSGTLTITTPTSAQLTNGQYVKVTVTDTPTGPSSIVWTAGSGVTFKSIVLGDTDSPPGTSNACGTPPATGTITYLWQWNSTAGTLQLIGCGADPAASTLTPALGGMIGATFGIGFDFVGTPSASQKLATNLAYTLNVPANYASPTSSCTCGTNPSETDAYTIKCNGSSKGTFSLSTSCVLTLPTQIAYTCTAGQRFEIDAPATVSGADIACTVAYTR